MYSSILDSTPRINQGQEKILINLSLPKVENGLLVTTLIDGKCKTQSDPRRRLQFGIAVCRLVFDFTVVSRARSLRNLLVSGNECGRVFPAGVGPGSPSRDAANWLPSRFSLSVETRRRYGWLRMMVFPGARLFPSPNLVPFGRVAARERQGALSRRAW